jgi:hypothetical protein
MRRAAVVLSLLLLALSAAACGGGGGSSSATSAGSTTSAGGGGAAKAKTPEQVWAKELEVVMRKFENSSARSVAQLHTSASQFLLEPTYAKYSAELAKLGKALEATDPPASCEPVYRRLGKLARKVSDLMGVLASQSELSPEEYAALAYQQTYKFGRVGRQLTSLTIDPHC